MYVDGSHKQLSSDVIHWFGYFCGIWGLSWGHLEMQVHDTLLAHHYCDSHHSNHPIVIICGIGEKLFKMADNSASYPLKSTQYIIQNDLA